MIIRLFVTILSVLAVFTFGCTPSQDILTPRRILEYAIIDTLPILSVNVTTSLNGIKQDYGTVASTYFPLIIKKDTSYYLNLSADLQVALEPQQYIALQESNVRTGLRLVTGKSYSNNGNSLTPDTTYTRFKFLISLKTTDTTFRDSLYIINITRDTTRKIDTIWGSVKVPVINVNRKNDTVSVVPSTYQGITDNALVTMVSYPVEKRILCTLTYTTDGNDILSKRLYGNTATVTIQFEIFYKDD